MRQRHTTLTALTIALAAVSLAACQKKEAAPPPPTDSSAAAAAPAAAPAPTLSVASIDLGKAIGADNKVSTPLTAFGARDTIYASVNTEGAAAGTLSARWSFVNGSKETVVDTSSRSISPTGPATTEFHISKKTAWPAGQYKVEISLNGASAGVKNFEVKK